MMSNAEADRDPQEAAPVKIYLDQSDWSNLQDGRAAQAANRLRELGRKRRAVFLISIEHFYETGKLMSGFKLELKR